jgi:hypothetical protein
LVGDTFWAIFSQSQLVTLTLSLFYKRAQKSDEICHFSSTGANFINHFETGLPDGLFSNQKSLFWVNFGGSCNGKSWYIL